jgi:L-ascorbate metabolism protein UlaG (beta-lactamase superfamily)
MVTLLFILACLFVVFALYKWYPPFGGRSGKRAFNRSANYQNQKFVNATPTHMDIGGHDVLSLARQEFGIHPDRHPTKPLALQQPTLSDSDQPHITWFGHSAFMLQINGKTILFDPMFGKRPSPFPGVGPKRFAGTPPLRIEDLPDIDAVLISHDHYDHLDYGSIKKLRAKTTKFYVPLGLGAHLRRWGVSEEQITELDWWDEANFEGLTFACTPARHFSGRTLTDRYATHWASWVVTSTDTRFFFSGDGGYGPHFKEIGEKYGPFDLTMMECGQYDKLWADIHMTPEQTLQAHLDLRGKRLIPMHWGAFVLSLHAWDDPILRIQQAAKTSGATIIAPAIGQTITLSSSEQLEPWWEAYSPPVKHSK